MRGFGAQLRGGARIDASSPSLFAGLPALEASLRGHVVAVVATDREGRIAVFSNRCGIVAKWCIAAPGEMVPVAATQHGPGYRRDGARLRRSVGDLPRRAPCDRGAWRC